MAYDFNKSVNEHSANVDRLRKKYPKGSTTSDKHGNLTAKSKAVESRKDGMSDRARARMKSYNSNARHNPKSGFLELSKDAPKRAHKYYNDLGK